MPDQKVPMSSGGRGTALAVQIKSGANSHRIEKVNFENGSVMIGLKSSSDQSEINSSLIAFLAEIFEVKPDLIEIVAGQDQNKKLVSILDIHPETVQAKLMRNLYSAKS